MDTQTATWESFTARPVSEQRTMILDAMSVIVGEAGEGFRYEGPCKYVKNEAPSCLIGRVLARLGMPLAIMAEWDDAGDGTIDAVADTHPFGLDTRTVAILAAAQELQDSQVEWVECLRVARDRASR